MCESTSEKSACKGSSFHERHGNQHIQRFLQDVQLIYGNQVEHGVRQVMYLTKCYKNTLKEGCCRLQEIFASQKPPPHEVDGRAAANESARAPLQPLQPLKRRRCYEPRKTQPKCCSRLQLCSEVLSGVRQHAPVAAEQDGGFEEREAAQAVHHAAHVLVEARGLNGGD